VRAPNRAAAAAAREDGQGVIVLLAADGVQRVDDRDVGGVDDGLAVQAVRPIQQHLPQERVGVVAEQLLAQRHAATALEGGGAQQRLEQPVRTLEVLPHRPGHRVVPPAPEGVDDVAQRIADDGDVPDRRVPVASQPEQPAQVRATDPQRQHGPPVPVEQLAQAREVLRPGLSPGQVLVLEHRQGVQVPPALPRGLLHGPQELLPSLAGGDLGQDEAG